MLLSSSATQVFLKPIQYVDYEVFLGPIPLYDWRGDSLFNIEFALSLLPACDGRVLPYSTVTPVRSSAAQWAENTTLCDSDFKFLFDNKSVEPMPISNTSNMGNRDI